MSSTVSHRSRQSSTNEIHHGRLYPNLDDVVDKGLVEKGEVDKRTNYYTITARGRRELEARREWENQYVGELLSSSK
ncbi:PadR family transcriptional regulator [Natrinema saccharevitans]|uniref:PadR family transcriptional regulator n=1 Tax=Natrinema saccharevitans TaxID=301967 RepID=A0A1S8ARB0_9EURY|nr:PadR family transcriptional regulator [Natrinema saccharevitans]